MQIQDGQAVVENGSTSVVAVDALVDWSTVAPGDVFTVPAGRNTTDYLGGLPYFVDHTIAPGSSVSGFWELVLTGAFGKPDGTVFYQIITDFYSNTGAPQVKFGAVDTRLLFDLAVALIDVKIGDIIATGGGGGGAEGAILTHSKTISGADIGAITIAMSFGATLDAIPFVGRPVMVKTSSGDDDIDCVTIDNISTTGYNVNLSGPAVSGHKINNIYILAA